MILLINHLVNLCAYLKLDFGYDDNKGNNLKYN